jgi:hypothetical protein
MSIIKPTRAYLTKELLEEKYMEIGTLNGVARELRSIIFILPTILFLQSQTLLLYILHHLYTNI